MKSTHKERATDKDDHFWSQTPSLSLNNDIVQDIVKEKSFF